MSLPRNPRHEKRVINSTQVLGGEAATISSPAWYPPNKPSLLLQRALHLCGSVSTPVSGQRGGSGLAALSPGAGRGERKNPPKHSTPHPSLVRGPNRRS